MTTIDLDSYGFPKSSGIFETIKTVDGAPIALGRHMRRAVESALELGIGIPSEEFIRSEMIRTLSENPHALVAYGFVWVRISFT
jgi:branched-subunit amino acid aminotransferase/4-amino-4-deoxychorismate lyase